MSLEMLDVARGRLDLVAERLTGEGLSYVRLPDALFGLGLAVPWSETEFTVVSVQGGGNENQLFITTGVLQDVERDRLTVLDACNRRTQDNPAYPVYLHDAEVGWDVLIQVSLPIRLLIDSPEYVFGMVRNLPIVTNAVRDDFAERGGVGGRPYFWTTEDANRLLLRSVV